VSPWPYLPLHPDSGAPLPPGRLPAPPEGGARRARRPRTSIPRILALSLALGTLVPFLPLACLTWSAYERDVERVEREIEESNRQIARLVANHLDEIVLRTRREALAAAGGSLPPPSSAVRWERVGANGEVAATQLAPGRVGAAPGYEAFLGALGADREVRFSRVGRWIEGMPPTVVAAQRLPIEAGAAFLAGVFDPDALHAEMTAWSSALVDRHVYAVDGGGRLIFYSDPQVSRQGLDLTSNPPVRLALEGGEGPIRFSSVASGKPRTGFVRRLANADWSVVVSADLGSQLVNLRQRYRVLGWTILFSVVAVVAILLWTSRRLARPLLEIRAALRSSSRPASEPLEVSASASDVAEYADMVEEFDNLSLRFAAAERELVRVEKASLLGQLASGIAHEMGTPLNVISGNAQYLLRKLATGDPARPVLQQVVKQSERITEMVHQLLDFARPTEVRRVALDVPSVVEQTLEMVSSVLRGVEVEVAIDPGTPAVTGDPRLLEHALLNLVVNARQAMPRGGRLSIAACAAARPDARPGLEDRWVRCRITDTGCGIAPEHLGRIFEPFYTTKLQGGTGLGLAIVERIVRQLEGDIEVESRPGEGTTFTLWLRPAEPPARGSPAGRSAPEPPPASQHA
jgi:signal transduction histidine kinase